MKKLILLFIILLSVKCYSQDRTIIRHIRPDVFDFTYISVASDTLGVIQDTLEIEYILRRPKHLIKAISFMSVFDNIDGILVEVYGKEFKEIRYKKLNVDTKIDRNIILNTYIQDMTYNYFKIRYIYNGKFAKLELNKFHCVIKHNPEISKEIFYIYYD